MYTRTTVRLVLIAVVGTLIMGTHNPVSASLPSTNLVNGATQPTMQNLVRRNPSPKKKGGKGGKKKGMAASPDASAGAEA
ncbi:hypothetical protein IWQ62_002314, partial [Dispira parvispora]